MKEKKVIIYCLIDPLTCKVRYIGRTTKKNITHRLIEHITKSKYFKRYHPNLNPTHKENWINSLLELGMEPRIRKLCEISGWQQSHDLERCLINKYLNSRNLTNHDDKGVGYLNRTITIEQKKAISDKLKLHYLNNVNARAKSIDVYDSDGNYLNTYKSANSFAKMIGVSASKVSEAARGNTIKRVKGYQIKYTDDNQRVIKGYIPTKKQPYVVIKTRKKIQVLNITSNETLMFTGIEECCRQLGINRQTYYSAKRRNRESSSFELGGYRFIS